MKRILPPNDELMQMWIICGKSNSKTAEVYGVGESSVRRAILRIMGPTGRPYNRVPMDAEALYAEWMKMGAGYGCGKRLAEKLGLDPQTVRRSIRRLRERNSEEEERREQDKAAESHGDGPDILR